MKSLTTREKIIIVGLTIIPLLFLVYMVCVYSVDIPKRDEWAFAALLDKYYTGALTWYDLFVQNNEHRLFFPYLIMLSTAVASQWDVRCWIACNVIFALGTFCALVLQLLSTSRTIKNRKILWLVPLCSLLVFSFRQHINWLWGIQMIVFMSVFFAVAGMLLLARTPLRTSNVVCAALMGVVGSFSFTNGMLIWPVGLVVLLLNQATRKSKTTYLCIWIAVSIISTALFLFNYHKPPAHPPLFFAVENLVLFFSFIFSYLASPFVATNSMLATLTGLAGTLMLAYATVRLWRSGAVSTTVMLPYLALGLYSFLNAVIIAVGRANWGVTEALRPRYVTHAFFFWIALAGILFLFFATCRRSSGHALDKAAAAAPLYVIIGLALWAAGASYTSIPCFFDDYLSAANLRTETQIAREEDFALDKVSAIYHKGYATMRKHKLAVFRDK